MVYMNSTRTAGSSPAVFYCDTTNRKQPPYRMNKELILRCIIAHLERDLAILFTAAKAAHEAAIHEQSLPDNEYDTLSLEASYVAQGQANRAQEIKLALETYKNLPLRHFAEDATIRLTALVTLETGDGTGKTVFIGPEAGGLRVTDAGREIIVITPHSPLGKGLIGKVAGDRVTLGKGPAQKEFEIVAVC
jgi:transcription elongation GreA/GreB family factor